MAERLGVDLIDRVRELVRGLATEHARRLAHLHYADIRLEVSEDTAPALYEVDPRTVELAEMVRLTTDVSRQVADVDVRVQYNYVSTMTELSRELFASSEGALIDQSFAHTQGLCGLVAVGPEAS